MRGQTNQITTKRKFVELYSKGVFGNHSPTWDTIDQFEDSGYKGLIHIRNRIAGGATWYNVEADNVYIEYRKALKQGLYPQQLYFSAMAPTEKTLFQGEVQRSNRHLDLFYTTVAKPMRDALKERSRQVYGVEADLLLQYYMNQRSYEWLQHLLDTYVDHVVEFSVYGVCWGTVPGFNTIYWEVRKY